MLNRPTSLALLLLAIGLNASAADKIYVGNVAPLTGVIAELGNEAAQSQKACIDSINARGGIRGKKVEILLRDDGFDPERYVHAATELIEQKKVVALLGGGGTLGIDLLLQRGILEKNQIPVIAPISGALSIRYPFNPYIFHIRASYPDEINRMMDQLEITGRSRIGIVYMNDSEGRAAYGLARLALKKKGMQLVAFSGYNKDLNDIEPAAKAMAAANLDTVIFAGLEEPAGKFLARLRTLGSSAQLYGLPFSGTSATPAERVKGLPAWAGGGAGPPRRCVDDSLGAVGGLVWARAGMKKGPEGPFLHHGATVDRASYLRRWGTCASCPRSWAPGASLDCGGARGARRSRACWRWVACRRPAAAR
jgi:ABC-type branched-subunit amino acid transport system substrate-binding protein